MNGKARTRVARLLATALLATSIAIVSATATSAAPSKADLDAAKAKLAALDQQMSALDEQYNQAQIKLHQTEAALAQAQSDMETARSQVNALRAQLSAQAAQAYESQGSAISVVLGSTSFSQLSDRVEFLQSIAQQNVDTATKAAVAEEQFRQASQALASMVHQRKSDIASLNAKRAQLQAGAAQTQQLISTIQASLKRQAAAAAIAAAAQPPGGGWDGNGSVLPPSGGAATAVAAAKSVLGVPYVYGAADPNVGFDCSGLTMWSWAQAGVYLPHSAQGQYDVTPHVARSDVQPGDLLFMYHPISHVSMYIGGGMEVAAHTTGTVVMIDPVPWGSVVGIGRP
ncbi:MAG TPA: NlpC/P60 family protein [Actinomycetota bacterium]